MIVSGIHKNLQGKVVSIGESEQRTLNEQKKVMGEDMVDDLEDDAYLGVELEVNSTTV